MLISGTGHYNAIAPSALKRTYLLRNRRAESKRGNNPNAPYFAPFESASKLSRAGRCGNVRSILLGQASFLLRRDSGRWSGLVGRMSQLVRVRANLCAALLF